MNTEQLIEEAEKWEPNKKINWSQLGSKYGLTTANRGQVIKEFLAEKGIPTACTAERTNRAPRRSKKKLTGGHMSFPMYQPVAVQKKKVSMKIESGEIHTGVEIVPTSYSADKASCSIIQQTTHITARKVPLISIRKKLLIKHEHQRLVRQYTDEQFENLSEEELRLRLKKVHEPSDCYSSIDQLRSACKRVFRTRHLKLSFSEHH